VSKADMFTFMSMLHEPKPEKNTNTVMNTGLVMNIDKGMDMDTGH
jgi:hypothetical protein